MLISIFNNMWIKYLSKGIGKGRNMEVFPKPVYEEDTILSLVM